MSSPHSGPRPAQARPMGEQLISNGLRLRRRSQAWPPGVVEESVMNSIGEWIVLAGILVQLAKSGLPEHHR